MFVMHIVRMKSIYLLNDRLNNIIILNCLLVLTCVWHLISVNFHVFLKLWNIKLWRLYRTAKTAMTRNFWYHLFHEPRNRLIKLIQNLIDWYRQKKRGRVWFKCDHGASEKVILDHISVVRITWNADILNNNDY